MAASMVALDRNKLAEWKKTKGCRRSPRSAVLTCARVACSGSLNPSVPAVKADMPRYSYLASCHAEDDCVLVQCVIIFADLLRRLLRAARFIGGCKKPVAKTTIRNRDGSLCASVPLWFNLPFVLMHTDEPRGEARLSCGLECIPAILQAVLADA